MRDIDTVNALLQPIIEKLEINRNPRLKGYTSAGTRNVSACIGSNVCPFATYNTTNFAKRMEKEIFPTICISRWPSLAVPMTASKPGCMILGSSV